MIREATRANWEKTKEKKEREKKRHKRQRGLGEKFMFI
jgi:hypothetical protein